MAASRPLVEGKKYHFNVIYNHALSRYSATPDTELSLRFVEFLVGKLTEWGYTEFYYYDEHALPGRNVFEELFRVVNGSQWSFVILTKEFSCNCWVKYCQLAAFKNLIDKTQRDRLIPIMVGQVQLPVELDVNGVLSFDDDQTTWDQGHMRQLNRLQRVLADNISVAAATVTEVKPVQEHGDGRVRSERDEIISEPQPSIQESHSDFNQNSHLEVDGSTGIDNTDSSSHHPNANDGIGEMGQNTDMNPARTSNHHHPQSVSAHSPTTDTATNIQEQMQTHTGVKKTSVSNTENTHNRATELEHNLPISSASTPVSTNTSPNSEGLSPQDSASQGTTTLCQLDQTEYKANTQASSEFSIQVSSAREATSRIAMVESGPTKKMEHIYNSHRSGKPLNSSEGRSSLQSVRESDIYVTTMRDSVDGLTVEEIVNRQKKCGVTTSVAAGCIPRPELSQGKTEQNKDVDRVPYEAEYPEQRMKELKFDCGGQHVENLSLSEDQDITLDQERSNLQHENISTKQMRPEELLNDFTQKLFELEGSSLRTDSLINNGSSEQGELTEPKHITSSSDAGYISAENISNNSISSSHLGKHNWEVHTDSSDGMDVKPNSMESDPKTHMGNSKYSGDVKSGNNQMDVVDVMKKERLVCTRGKESKPEKVTDNKNKDEEVPVRGERPRPVGSEADTSFSMISTSRSVARDIDGYREVLLRSIFHSITKTDMLSSWS